MDDTVLSQSRQSFGNLIWWMADILGDLRDSRRQFALEEDQRSLNDRFGEELLNSGIVEPGRNRGSQCTSPRPREFQRDWILAPSRPTGNPSADMISELP